DQILTPTIAKLQDAGELAYGPHAADSFFGSGAHHKSAAILASNPDQALIPLKTLSLGKAANNTARHSKVRTSPDYGTALQIAVKVEADPRPYEEEVFTALRMYKNREEYKELTQNPLKKSSGKL